jgi:hypothetical protein
LRTLPTNACLNRPENLRRSVDRINKHLCGKKKLDLFELARVVPIEDRMKMLSELVKGQVCVYRAVGV